MIRLYIDNVAITPLKHTAVMPRYATSKLRDVNAWRSGESIEVEVASSAETDAVMLHAADMHRAESFNEQLHNARLTIDGTTIFEGYATLIATRHEEERLIYTLRLRNGGAEWAKRAALTTLGKSDITYDTSLTIGEIERSWSDERPIKFLPLQRDSYPKPQESGLFSVERILMPQDYHPFISVKAIVDDIIKGGGYTLHSDFMNSEFFKRLMISGAYRSVDGSAAESTMGFKAYRSRTTTATASQSGTVNICEPYFQSNIGAIADTIDAMATDDAGNRFSDAYAKGGHITFVDGEPIFTPSRDVSVSFEYFIHYTTECRIISGSLLQGFTKIHLANGCDIDVAIRNPYSDRRNEITPSTRYKLMVFNHRDGYSYKLEGLGEGLSEECSVVSPTNARGSTRLCYRTSASDTYHPFDGDWALYDGHVERTLTREVMLTARTPYERVTPTHPKHFNDIYFGGAIEGQMLTLHSGCHMRPLFSGVVGYGDTVGFEDVAHHNINQAQVLDAVIHLFNLCIYTHEPSKRVYIEPYDTFFNGKVIDWRTRQTDGTWHYEEGAPDCFERITLCYAGNDGVVRRVTQEGEEYAEWEFDCSGYGCKMGTERRANPIFFPSAAFTESTTTAPSAEIVTVGNRDDMSNGDYIEPRILLYHGLRELPSGERWQAYNTLSSYPFASFHSPNADATLSFNDRDNLVGLHRYYDRELRESLERGVFTCSIRLRPDEYLDLLDPASEDANIRSHFRLRSEYGSSLFTLLGIEAYDTTTHIATCRFRRTLTD